ncbi:MAG: Hsp70 family protein, partial [Victivallales bacterium]|nr:Hsp70 family protein [Victivallales bacterium]
DGTPYLMQNQQVVLTVPASFDETARELTVQAARQAGLEKLTLIEEPLAAFYAWLGANQQDWKQKVAVGDVVLVVDIGGGTTDLTIVEIEDDYTLRRKAVGEHLLLGGDNMDMTLAHVAESVWNTKLPQRQWSRLCQECRRVKEKLLSADAPETMQVAVAGEGSSIFASLKTFDFKRNDIQTTILDGFFPFVEKDSQPPERRRGIQAMGLPYAADPAVTKHILAFLKFAGQTLRNPAPVAIPNKILFNGGTLIPELLRQRIRDVIAHWNNGLPRSNLNRLIFHWPSHKAPPSMDLRAEAKQCASKAASPTPIFWKSLRRTPNDCSASCRGTRMKASSASFQKRLSFKPIRLSPFRFMPPPHAWRTNLETSWKTATTSRRCRRSTPSCALAARPIART